MGELFFPVSDVNGQVPQFNDLDCRYYYNHAREVVEEIRPIK